MGLGGKSGRDLTKYQGLMADGKVWPQIGSPYCRSLLDSLQFFFLHPYHFSHST
jgi:hypothetical protein